MSKYENFQFRSTHDRVGEYDNIKAKALIIYLYRMCKFAGVWLGNKQVRARVSWSVSVWNFWGKQSATTLYFPVICWVWKDASWCIRIRARWRANVV